MKLQRRWRRWPVSPPDQFEPALRRLICERAPGTIVREMLAYHFGYSDTEMARRGKRLRPRLVFAVAQDAGAPEEDALDAAVAIEALHNYSLIHDDIEDGDRLRHGRETLWVRYGIAQAINAGDALCALSFLALLRAGERHPAQRVTRMVERLHEAHLAMSAGQSLDIAFETQTAVTPQRYLEMIGGKTAALFAAASELGALSAGLEDALGRHYHDLGVAFGTAFQIYDDVLGIWADAQSTGKTAGADIVRRKKTYPVVWALQGPADAQRRVIAQAYAGTGEMAPETVEKVVAALNALGAREAAHRLAANHLAVVERAPLGRVRDFLLSLLPVAAPT